ncbi:SRPBCC family protein [Nocardioides sp. TRM66260-LWL]|uniref:SRPBCC family protein n=1 Tax=Nocardioides sp. TRM66260-LWL TaxID=2874478 RepID=UPI001CC7A266|nr:SRPBCC family protein [Nocardioides sp. TRM66260-LWL]MBZ5734568.1 SRPBCC family protein [Nocardioides sp. TRM66260-LWL]
MHVERTFTVPRPPEVVYDYLVDFTRTEEWDPGTVRTTLVEGAPDLGVGTRYANTSQFMGREVELTYTTEVAERPHRLEFQGVQKSSTARDILSFTPATVDGQPGTRLHYRAEFRFSGVLKVLAPLVVPFKLRSLADETVEQLRRTLVERA